MSRLKSPEASRAEPVTNVGALGRIGCGESLSVHMSSLDGELYKLMLSLDILSPPDIFDKPRCNILVAQPASFDEKHSWGSLIESPLPKAKDFPKSYWNGLQNTKYKAVFPCSPELKEFLHDAPVVLLTDVSIGPPFGSMTSDHLHLITHDDSKFLPWYFSGTSRYTMLDLCAGGYGGWSHALKITDELGFPHHHVINIEISLPAATQLAINHSTILMPDRKLPLTWFLHKPCDITIHGDICHLRCQQALSMLGAHIWTFSFPCKSWSSSGYAKGFRDQNGKVFAHGMCLAKQMRPKLILLENVKNFTKHDQFTLLKEFIQWCGFRVVIDGIFDADAKLPVKRPRWLAILQRIEDDQIKAKWESWGPPNQSTPQSWDAWIHMTDQDAREFQLTKEEAHMYLSTQLLPKYAPAQSANNMLKYRVPPLSMKLPTFMAAYGYHHQMPRELLESDGLHGHFLMEQGCLRWWSPLEVALLHFHKDPLALLKPKKLAWQTLGNCITVHHALFVLLHGMQMLFDPRADFQFQSVFQQLEGLKLNASEVQIAQDQFAWYMNNGPTDLLQDKVKFLEQHLECAREPTMANG